ncbi:MAG: class I SAM-dependent methyltransferase [Candidatus Kuenenia sp.]|nr:class I SAM-dependent methyltransferase [Candidatus Kuenenia hertensis]
MSETIPDIGALKAQFRATWATGNFGEIAKSYEDDAVEFVDRLKATPGLRVLDVACGTGNIALPCARTGACVTGVDIVPNLLEQGRNRAKTEGLQVKFDEGDAENLPYPDNTFDLVVTKVNTMFLHIEKGFSGRGYL